MSDKKDAPPGDVRAAAQAALQAAQDAASGALRVPAASAQIVAQLPGLLENLAAATERLNSTLDRVERYMALADPTLQAMDRILPQLEALAAQRDAAFRAVTDLPGAFGRITGLTPREEAAKEKGKSPKKPRRKD